MDPKIAPYSQNSDLKSANKFKDEEQFEEEEEEGVGELVEEVDEKETGWSGLKKAAVAGVAVAAAPAVVPPALALSAVGIALSLPFAACLAALACTHRLIRALLPSSSPYLYQSGRSIEHPRFGFDPYTSDEDDEVPSIHCFFFFFLSSNISYLHICCIRIFYFICNFLVKDYVKN